MRDYGRISPRFWIGETGRKIRSGGPESTIVALYLMTSPHANMLGYYYMPISFIAHETGLSFEGASEGIRRCIEAGLCSYHSPLEVVWVHKMAVYQVAENLKPNDNRVKAVADAFLGLPETPFLSDFAAFYGERFNLPDHPALSSPSEAPSKPLRSQEQEQEQEQEQDLTSNFAIASLEVLPGAENGAEPERKVAVIELPLNVKNTYHPITQEDIDQWAELYPAVDVLAELRKMLGWLNANPARRKTKSGVARFVNNWLSAQQDKGGQRATNRNSGKGSSGNAASRVGARLGEIMAEELAASQMDGVVVRSIPGDLGG